MDCCFWMSDLYKSKSYNIYSEKNETGIHCNYCNIFIVDNKDYSFFIKGPHTYNNKTLCIKCIHMIESNESDL